MSNTIRHDRTDQFRFRLLNRRFSEPLIVLQMEFKAMENKGYTVDRWVLLQTYWRDVRLEDLTIMSLKQLIQPREGGEMPTCFKPLKLLFGWCLVLQVLDGAYEHNKWRPARVQDLMIKDGKIQGGLGLVSR